MDPNILNSEGFSHELGGVVVAQRSREAKAG